MNFLALILVFLTSRCLFSVAALLLPLVNITDHLYSSYDYIIVGGGVSGLVVANRLSENSSVTVLVLEAGELDNSEDRITVPGLVGHGYNPAYDWNLTTVPQEFLDNNSRPYCQGHVLGGSSILNGLVTTRGSSAKYDAWEALGNPGWGWRGLLPYFKKSENFTTVVDREAESSLHIQPELSQHGFSGPLQVGYPRYFYNQSSNFLRGISELGVPILNDPNAGTSAGGMMVPSSVSAMNQSRMDSRRAYLDGVMERPNLHVASGQTVARIMIKTSSNHQVPPFGSRKRAYGVENATCTREVILAVGGILSPVLLQVSGIGPAPLLRELNVSVEVDLPGVGHNLQDHAMVGAFYDYTQPGLFSTRNLTGDVLQQAQEEYSTNRTGPLTPPLISTVAFPSLRSLTNNWSSIMQSINSTKPEQYLPPGPGRHPHLIAGFGRQRELLLELLDRTDVGVLEILADSIGTLTVAIQRPFSRGSVHATSSDLLVNNASLASSDSITDRNESALLEAIHQNLATEFHPCGTTAMLPFELGGVVDSHLVVYGTDNLRVVDAGIMPIIPAAHLQAAVYAVAEKAAHIITEDNSALGHRGPDA
ncbi:putative GMC oxidoreductase [Podospora aff. communis PSN243]|uniref:GMC oxidoreductase n=1 Tax=Podospora aff. communis PSN243 TaxID=3040156 RepID=A0AAV9GKD6_9PEZI|nr:putative GMC oxidoreductase [Podospora aff. communis PSN243]